MRCTICKKEGEEILLFEGIYNAEMVRVCEPCAEKEGIPMMKKPTERQLEKAEERYTVRERMEVMSGVREATDIGEEQTKIQGNLARLKMPDPKQKHPEIHDNYYWTVNMARRRKKMSLKQVSQELEISEAVLNQIEKGKIPKDFEDIFLKLERFFGVELLKNHKPQITFKTPEPEEDILAKVQRRMDNPGEEDVGEESDVSVEEFNPDAEDDGLDLSKREDFKEVTLNELVSRKKHKEIKEKQKKKRIQTDAMVGDDLDLDIDEI